MNNFASLLDTYSQYTTPLNAFTFAEAYLGRRRLAYIRAAQLNQEYGFENRLAHTSPFMKVEKYNFTAKPDAVPRIITPRNPRYVVETGRYVKPIEKRIYRAIDDIFGSVTVFKGLNNSLRGQHMRKKWDKYGDPVALGLDAKRFDQHVSLPALQWEHSRYKKYYPNDKFFSKLMKLQEHNKAHVRGKDFYFKYEVEGTRCSGDSNTSLGNVLLMCGMVYAFLEFVGVKADLVDDGDDCVLFMERRDLLRVTSCIDEFFLKLGFELTVEDPVDIFEKVVFCQSQPVYDGTEWLMVRDPRTSISKDCVALKPLDNKNVYQKWCAAVGAGGLHLTYGMPVYQSFYDVFMRESKGAEALIDPTLEGGFFRQSKGMTRIRSPVSPEARCSFWKAFDISPEAQIAIEDYYNNYVVEPGSTLNRWTSLPL